MSLSGFLEHLEQKQQRKESCTASTQLITSRTEKHKAAQRGKHHVVETCFSLLLLPGTGSPLGLGSLHNTMLNLGLISLLSHEEQQGKGIGLDSLETNLIKAEQ